MSISIQTSQGLVKVAGNSFNNPMVGATETTDGKSGIVPAPLSSEKDCFLKGDGTWSEVAAGTQSNWNESDSTSNAFIKNKPTSMPASDVYSWAKAEEKPTYTAAEVGADKSGSAAAALTLAKTYTDEQINNLVVEESSTSIVNTASGESIHLTDSADAKVVEFGLYGKATQNGEPTPDAPVEIEVAGSSGNVVVKSIGANLLNYESWKNVATIRGTSVFENNGITITATDNSCYTDYPPNSSFPLNARIPVKEGDKITLSWEESSNKSGRIFIFGCNESNFVDFAETNNNTSKSLTYTAKSGIAFVSFRFAVENAGDIISYKNIMINKGSVPLPYEPYTGTSSTIPTPNGLVGIEVDNGGNYTDENGQQWICDEIVKYADGSGEYVQRIVELNYDDFFVPGFINGGYRIRTNGSCADIPQYSNALCTHAVLNNNLDCYSVKGDYLSTKEGNNRLDLRFSTEFSSLEECKNYMTEKGYKFYVITNKPIRTPLTSEQIAEIEKLQTYSPITNIFNDADCGMDIQYFKDTMDSKIIAGLSASIASIPTTVFSTSEPTSPTVGQIWIA